MTDKAPASTEAVLARILTRLEHIDKHLEEAKRDRDAATGQVSDLSARVTRLEERVVHIQQMEGRVEQNRDANTARGAIERARETAFDNRRGVVAVVVSSLALILSALSAVGLWNGEK